MVIQKVGFRRSVFSFVLTLLLAVQNAGFAADAPGPVEKRGAVRVTKTVSTQFPYLVITPVGFRQTTQRWPVIIFLHGSEQSGRDLNLLKLNGPPRTALMNPEFPFVVIAPQLAPGKVWDGDAVAAFAKQVVPRYRGDATRVYLTGLSTGGYGTWSAGVKYPERFAAIVPVAGGGDTVLLKHAEGEYLNAAQSLAVWAFHGGSDGTVAPSESQRMVSEFQRIGNGNTKITVFPGASHDIWNRVYDDPALYDWLLNQHR